MIGTNGAGKSTLSTCSRASCRRQRRAAFDFGGHDVDALAAAAARPRRASAAATSAPPSSRVHACSRTAASRAQARAPRALGIWQPARALRRSLRRGARALDAPGSSTTPTRIAGTLSHGAKRQLEIAMCLATAPRVLLLDEPLAGMGAEETERMLALLRGAEARARDPAGRARHGRGLPHRRPHHGDGQRRA